MKNNKKICVAFYLCLHNCPNEATFSSVIWEQSLAPVWLRLHLSNVQFL